MELVWKKFSFQEGKNACHRCSYSNNTSGCDVLGSKKVTEVRSRQYLDVRPPREGKMLEGILTVMPWRLRAALGAALWRFMTPGGSGKSKSRAVWITVVLHVPLTRRQVWTTCGYSKKPKKSVLITLLKWSNSLPKTTQTQKITKQNKQKHKP